MRDWMDDSRREGGKRGTEREIEEGEERERGGGGKDVRG